MIKNYLKTAFRIITRNKAYSFLNIIGLATGMAACLLILLYVHYELSFDRYHQNASQIYRIIKEDPGNYYLGSNQYALTPAPLAQALIDEYPEILSVTRIDSQGNNLISYGKKTFLEPVVHFADPQTFEIFTFHFIRGDSKTALQDPYSIVLSESMAQKYFGDEDPMGKILNYREAYDFKVTGVFKAMPKNSHFTADFLIPFESLGKVFGWKMDIWGDNSFYTYFLLREGADPGELEEKFPALIDKYAGDRIWSFQGQKTKYLLQPLTKIHLYSHVNFEISPNSDIKYIYIFTSIALLILIIACINYMNLATARSAKRAKEVGMRKVVGAHRKQLIRQFMGESVMMTLLSLSLALILVAVSLPAFNRFIERPLTLNLLENHQFLLGLFAVVVFVGLFAGSYPSVYISSFRPISVLRGAFSRGHKGKTLRNGLVVAQFIISIILIASTIVVRNQLHFIQNREMGYNREQILVMSIHDRNLPKKMEALRTELKSHPNITHVSLSRSLPNHVTSERIAEWPGKPDDVHVPIYVNEGDYEFIDLFEIEMARGRNFSPDFPSDANGAILLNETAVKALGWEDPLGREMNHWGREERSGTVVGVIKDFHMHSLHLEIKPLYVFLNPKSGRYISIKVKEQNLPGTIDFIRGTIREFSPQYPFNYQFFDDIFDRAYRAEQKIGTQFSVFAMLAILIACLGLFGLASFTAEQRTKEIGIRKILGASVSHIAFLLSREFTKWVVIANIVAWPIAYYVMTQWLQNFAYKVNLGLFSFLLAGAFALFIALLTVSFQTIRAATANPVDSLRYE